MAKALAALYGAGGLLTALSITLPHSPLVNEPGALALAAVAVVAALIVLGLGSKLPLAGFQALITLGSGMVSLGVHFGGYGLRTPSYAFFYLWVILYAFSFFPLIAAMVQTGIAALAHLSVLAIDNQASALISDWSLTWGILLVTGFVVGWLSGQVEELAVTDMLTGLRNRRAWEEELKRELARATRTGHPVSVVLLDVDGLKIMNDTHGHQAGDRLLKEAAAAWSGSLRMGDFLARLGGDEFGLLLSACPPDGAEKALERLRAATSIPFSAGCATWERDETADDLIYRADRALYENKNESRGQPKART
jgi:diguanylate cyclase (GGDEF)-like protein